MMTDDHHRLDQTHAWALLLALARRASDGRPVVNEVGLRLDDQGRLEEGVAEPWIIARPKSRGGWSPAARATSPEAAVLLDLQMPLCVGESSQTLVIGHLAQSLDGRIATVSGKSQFISSHENLIHAHRLRALSDVLLVGSRTIVEDDPQLSTRLVPGPSPVRAIVDPGCRLAPDHRVFQDSAEPTLLFCRTDAARGAPHHGRGRAEVIAIEPAHGQLPVTAILAELRRRGLRRVFVEGGGMTVSSFVKARALTRLQVTVAPLLFGSGRATLTLPEIDDLAEALTLECRHFPMGPDMLFDCVFTPLASDGQG
jgi:diaminohydroxyphosphoribosylaminopyrimidine deaminase/5-amino-6-(5-phosphoribosylamino)uracil reductase